MHAASTSLATTTITALIAHPPLDAIIIFVFLIVILIDSLRSGTARAATLAVALPLTSFFSTILSHAAIIGPMIEKVSAPLPQAAVFGILFAILFFLVYRIMYAMGSGGISPLVAIVASFAATIVTLVMWLQVPALQSLWHFSPLIQSAFGTPHAFWWLIAGFLLMAFVRS